MRLPDFKTAVNLALATALVLIGVTVLAGLLYLCAEFWILLVR